MTEGDRGSVTIWVLGLSVVVLLFGGLALDYWRALALQRELAAVADSAAVAAASGIDEEVYRSGGGLVLAPARSRQLAQAAIDWQEVALVDSMVDVSVTEVSVTLVAEVELGLLGVFVDDRRPLTVRASASAYPELVP